MLFSNRGLNTRGNVPNYGKTISKSFINSQSDRNLKKKKKIKKIIPLSLNLMRKASFTKISFE